MRWMILLKSSKKTRRIWGRIFVCLFVFERFQSGSKALLIFSWWIWARAFPWLWLNSIALIHWNLGCSWGKGDKLVLLLPGAGRNWREQLTHHCPSPFSMAWGPLLLAPTQLSLPDRAAGSSSLTRSFFDVWKRSRRESTQLPTDSMGFKEVPIVSHPPGRWWGRPTATRQVPSTHWQGAGYLHTCPD